MRIKKARQILKSLADDTRLRIINLLDKQELTVTELGKIIGSNQSNLSKHLARLRLTEVVVDDRRGLNVHYKLAKPENRPHAELVKLITANLCGLKVFKEDIEKLKELKKQNRKKGE